MDLTWIKAHKWVVAVFGAAAGGYILYSYLHGGSSSGTASSVVGGTATTGSPQYLVPVIQGTASGSGSAIDGSTPSPIISGGNTSGNGTGTTITAPSPLPPNTIIPNPTSTTPSSNIPVPVTVPTTNPTSISQPSPPTSPPIAVNPYSVGTAVTKNETITQSVYDPLYNGWLDLTSKGGIYGGGLNVAGSGYNPAWSGSGRLALANGGAQVQEYDATGNLVGTYTVGK